ncbi:enoyl-CoA hydratase [Skermania sp. ID1734]|uniref:enoyl-CoA hydratase n=1 Tax=Skermania sp. ID1734 TaxID=2597516 RepID=UPI00117FC58F|nr:enoyl-CoA hydratase [Skermania sp. ID1734]TSE02157.1 enoyl-CoA hydratase [Skermania sp. ID1734]
MSGTSSLTAGFEVVRDGAIARVTLTKPHRLNAIDMDAMIALGDCFSGFAADPTVRAVILTGAGKAFCAGADLAGDEPDHEQTMNAANRMVRSIIDCPVPVIARVNGAAAGIGVALALACDLVYASTDAYLLLAFINIGLMPDGGAAALVAASAGRARAKEMALLGERLPATQAVVDGMVNAALPADELDARVEAVAAKLANGPRRAQELTKAALNRASLSVFGEVLVEEKRGQIELLGSADFREGVDALFAKRKAVFGQ